MYLSLYYTFFFWSLKAFTHLQSSSNLVMLTCCGGFYSLNLTKIENICNSFQNCALHWEVNVLINLPNYSKTNNPATEAGLFTYLKCSYTQPWHRQTQLLDIRGVGRDKILNISSGHVCFSSLSLLKYQRLAWRLISISVLKLGKYAALEEDVERGVNIS